MRKNVKLYHNVKAHLTKVILMTTFGSSVSTLVKLIGDKYVHQQALVDDLLKDEHFGSNDHFDEKKYAEYFLNTFPNLLLFLIKSACLAGFENVFGKLKEKYFLNCFV